MKKRGDKSLDKKETTLIYNVGKKPIKFFEKNQKNVLTERAKGVNIIKLSQTAANYHINTACRAELKL